MKLSRMRELLQSAIVLLALLVVSVSALDSATFRLFPKSMIGSHSETVHRSKKQSSRMCPAGWTPYGDHCYQVSRISTTWQVAMRTCRNLNACLVQIDNSEENSFIGSLVRASPEGSFVMPTNKSCEHYYSSFRDSVWIGLNDMQTEGTHVWSDCGWPRSQFTVWQDTEPNDYEDLDEDCVEMFTMDNERGSDRWNDVTCSCSRAFVCERQSNRNTIITKTSSATTTTKLSPRPRQTTRRTTLTFNTTVAPSTAPSKAPPSTTTTVITTTRAKTVVTAPTVAAVTSPVDDLSMTSPGWEVLMTSPGRELFIAGLIVVGLGFIIAAVLIVRCRQRRRKPGTMTMLVLASSDSPQEAVEVTKVDDQDHLYTEIEIATYSNSNLYSDLRSSYSTMPNVYTSLKS